MMMALIGTTIERKTTINKMNVSPSTNASTIGVRWLTRCVESAFRAVWPVT